MKSDFFLFFSPRSFGKQTLRNSLTKDFIRDINYSAMRSERILPSLMKRIINRLG